MGNDPLPPAHTAPPPVTTWDPRVGKTTTVDLPARLAVARLAFALPQHGSPTQPHRVIIVSPVTLPSTYDALLTLHGVQRRLGGVAGAEPASGIVPLSLSDLVAPCPVTAATATLWDSDLPTRGSVEQWRQHLRLPDTPSPSAPAAPAAMHDDDVYRFIADALERRAQLHGRLAPPPPQAPARSAIRGSVTLNDVQHALPGAAALHAAIVEGRAEATGDGTVPPPDDPSVMRRLRAAALTAADPISVTTVQMGEATTSEALRRAARDRTTVDVMRSRDVDDRPAATDPAGMAAAIRAAGAATVPPPALPLPPPAPNDMASVSADGLLLLHEATCECPEGQCYGPYIHAQLQHGHNLWLDPERLRDAFPDGDASPAIHPDTHPQLTPPVEAALARDVAEFLSLGIVEPVPEGSEEDPAWVRVVSNLFGVEKGPLRYTAEERSAVTGRVATGPDYQRIRGLAATRVRSDPPPTTGSARDFDTWVSRQRDAAAATTRAVIDLRAVNELQPDIRFVYDSLTNVTHDWVKGARWYVRDIAKGYYHIPLTVSARRYACFSFRGRMYRFCRLPMGGKLSPAMFCWVSGELTRVLRALGVDIALTYVDDNLGRAASDEAGHLHMRVQHAIFSVAGATIKASKDQGPALRVTALGVDIDSATDTLCITREKFFSTMVQLHALRHITRRGVATGTPTYASLDRLRSDVGSANWLSALTTGGAAFASGLWQPMVAQRFRPRIRLDRSPAWRAALDFWCDDASVAVVRVVRPAAHSVGVGVIRSDAAGDEGFGAICLATNEALWGMWEEDQKGSISYQELYAALAAAWAWGSSWRGHLMRFEIDNASVAYTINSGRSTNEAVATLMRALYALAREHGFDFYAEWRPRELNTHADALSKARTLAAANDALRVLAPRRPPRAIAVPRLYVGADGRIQAHPR